MKKVLIFIVFLFGFINISMADPLTRVSVFSTSVDWAAVTGLGLRQYTIDVTGGNKDLIQQGLVLFYLDGFPCYGEADSVRLWVSPKNKVSGNLRLVCVHKPENISFAWRNAEEKAYDTKTEGIFNCPISSNLKIDLAKCTQGKKWTEYK